MKKEEISDQSYNTGIKSIIRRDFFPDLNPIEFDETIDKMNLNSFCNKYISKDESQFIKSIENDRKLLRSSAPKPDIKLNVVDEKKMNPWPVQEYNNLFYEPQTINKVEKPKGVLMYNNKKKIPMIRFSQTRMPDETNTLNLKSDYPSYHPFTTESSLSESDSEFEGTSKYSSIAINSYQGSKAIRRDRLERRKKKNELSSRGLELLKSLEANS